MQVALLEQMHICCQYSYCLANPSESGIEVGGLSLATIDQKSQEEGKPPQRRWHQLLKYPLIRRPLDATNNLPGARVCLLALVVDQEQRKKTEAEEGLTSHAISPEVQAGAE